MRGGTEKLPGPIRSAAKGFAPFGATPKHSMEGFAMFTRTASKALLASVAAGLVTFALTPAHAEIGAPRSMLVRYSDLDLQTASGKTRLQKRIAFAAETVCGPADGLSYFSRQATAACETNAISNASRGMVEVFAQAGNGTIRVAAN